MEYKTADGHFVTDEMLEEEASELERGGRPASWKDAPPRQVNTTLPAWVVDAADSEAARLNISRKAVLNIWLAEKAEQTLAKHHTPASA